MTRVLIPYGTTEGLTAKISEFVADVVRSERSALPSATPERAR